MAALLLLGCSTIFGPDDDFRAFEDARELWHSKGIEDYEFTVRNNCFCVLGGVPVRIVVAGGEIVSATVESSGEPVPSEFLGTYRTVDALFEVILDAHDRDATTLRTRYDFVFGFPDDVWIDYSARIADEEFGWAISDFVQIAHGR